MLVSNNMAVHLFSCRLVDRHAGLKQHGRLSVLVSFSRPSCWSQTTWRGPPPSGDVGTVWSLVSENGQMKSIKSELDAYLQRKLVYASLKFLISHYVITVNS